LVKTNVMRLLEQAGIAFTPREYEVDEDDLSGVHAAAMMQVAPEMLFKTLVAATEKNVCYVFCIPVAEELDLKKAAQAAGEKKIEMLHVKDLLKTTGYIRGGCSPIGMKKKFPTFIDETAQLFDEIGVSAGQRGAQIFIAPDDLAAFTDGKYVDLTKENG